MSPIAVVEEVQMSEKIEQDLKEEQVQLETQLVTISKKTLLAKAIYDRLKKERKEIENSLCELLEKRRNEEKMPLLQAMIKE